MRLFKSAVFVLFVTTASVLSFLALQIAWPVVAVIALRRRWTARATN